MNEGFAQTAVLLSFVIAVLVLFAYAARKLKRLKASKEELDKRFQALKSGYDGLARSDKELESRYEDLLKKQGDLARSEEKYRLAAEAVDEGLWHYDPETGKTSVSEGFCGIYGYSHDDSQMLIANQKNFIHPQDLPGYLKIHSEIKHGLIAELKTEYRILHKNGYYKWVASSARASFSEDGSVSTVAGVIVDINEQKAQEEKLSLMAYNDTLTGLPNRLGLYRKLEEQALSEHDSRQKTALMLIDLDHFREVNERLGHRRGNAILKEVGLRLQEYCSNRIFSARAGGDEFAVMTRDWEDPNDLSEIACDIQELIRKPFMQEGKETALTASIGIAVSPSYFPESDLLIISAERALRNAKMMGRGAMFLFQEEKKEKIS